MFRKFDSGLIAKMSKICQQNPHFEITDSVSRKLHLDGSLTSGRRRAAVLIPLVNRNGVPSLLFQLRSQNVGTHKGHVSFPGGHLEPGETIETAAIREMSEEMGRCPKDLETDLTIIGTGQTVISATGTLVTPLLGFLHSDVGDLSQFSPNADEVERIFTRTLDELSDASRNSFQTLTRNNATFEAAVFGVNDEEEKIWGLTAMILNATLKRVVFTAYADHEGI